MLLRSHLTQDLARDGLVDTLAAALDARDPYTAGHSSRVADYSVAIAQELGLPASALEILRRAAHLHDIGKIGIPDTILRKPGSLTLEEFGLVKLHPQIGRRILEKTREFEPFLQVVELHHENLDGTGYPYRLRGTEIPMEARIVRVADTLDAITTDRSYHLARTTEAALAEIQRCAGTQFDPDVVQALLRAMEKAPGLLLTGGLISKPQLTATVPMEAAAVEAA